MSSLEPACANQAAAQAVLEVLNLFPTLLHARFLILQSEADVPQVEF